MSPNRCGNYFFFLFFNQLFPLSSLLSHLWNSLSCLPSSLPLHSHSLPLSSSIYSADLKPLSCRQSRLKPPRLELPILSGALSLSLSLSLSACGNVCNSGWLILVGGDGFITMVGFGSGFATVVGCGGGGCELGGSGSELLKWIFYFVFLYIYIVDFLMLF